MSQSSVFAMSSFLRHARHGCLFSSHWSRSSSSFSSRLRIASSHSSCTQDFSWVTCSSVHPGTTPIRLRQYSSNFSKCAGFLSWRSAADTRPLSGARAFRFGRCVALDAGTLVVPTATGAPGAFGAPAPSGASASPAASAMTEASGCPAATGASDTSMASPSSGVSSPGPPPFPPPGESAEDGALGAESVEDGELSVESSEDGELDAEADGIAPSNAGAPPPTWTIQNESDGLGNENTHGSVARTTSNHTPVSLRN